ncbi:hypothetical protein [uncultured Corynebacterium sp.]|uniref:hypothetical protein n=1 Tax=uncultured Corynebacterium sp. TaxID=159447 RepID=UPI00262A281A|nr:hypothetical protein [uncultured Corynebacterium sp.]
MTSPIGGAPKPTNDRYNDVYGVGSRFGQDLTEARVRELLSGKNKSSGIGRLIQGFNSFVGEMVGGIAKAISGKGGATFEPIAGAVKERIDPINTAISESGERHAKLADKVDGLVVEQEGILKDAEAAAARVDSLSKKADDALGDTRKLLDFKSEFDADIQPKINKSLQDSDNALKAVQDEIIQRQNLGEKFDDAQVIINKATQEQLWGHQDMIELLDIRSPKVFYSLPGYSKTHPDGGYTKWKNPYKGGESANLINKQFTSTYEHVYADGVIVYIACKGSWTGQVVFHANFDKGQLDEYVFDVTKDKRVFKFKGGALHLNARFYSITVYVNSLNRTATWEVRDGVSSSMEVTKYTDLSLPRRRFVYRADSENLSRFNRPEYIRLKNVAVCDQDLYARGIDGERILIKAGEDVIPRLITPEDQTHLPHGTRLTFTEVADRTANWKVREDKPDSGSTVTDLDN